MMNRWYMSPWQPINSTKQGFGYAQPHRTQWLPMILTADLDIKNVLSSDQCSTNNKFFGSRHFQPFTDSTMPIFQKVARPVDLKCQSFKIIHWFAFSQRMRCAISIHKYITISCEGGSRSLNARFTLHRLVNGYHIAGKHCDGNFWNFWRSLKQSFWGLHSILT